MPIHDPRPTDLAELAQLTAVELRKIPVLAWYQGGTEVWAMQLQSQPPYPSIRRFSYSMLSSDFDNLGPIACASAIQALEVRRAQEWAGDK